MTGCRAADELADALRLTVEYVGTETLPAIPGWSWFDALTKHRPEMARLFIAKPDEPTGLGAVVKDAEGDVWVHDRDPQPGYLGVEWLNVRTQAHRRYDEIDAVRVLSEGVTP